MKGHQDMALRTGRARTANEAVLTTRSKAALLASSAALAALTLGVGALASSPPASAKSAGKAVTIKAVSVPKLGTVLATNAGLTLYRFAVDPVGKVTCTATCAKIWPPFVLPKGVSHIKTPHGVKGLSLVRVKGGRLQVFFHHQALYTFVNDKKGNASGQGVENDWFAVLSNGKSSALISANTPNSTAPPASPGTPGTPGAASTATTPAAGTSMPTSTPTTPKVTTPTSASNSGSGSTPAPTTPPPATQPTSPPTTQPPTTQPPTTQPPTTPTTAPPSSGYGY
jgi:predicted lipoprotein with Yx(FWY)xxD motif